ncbi:basic leucine zipper transcriptional factor ATF-like 2 [Aquarana catesbeiana]|uniref:basic leucine zipper transcriptional factor ATF-like 2 n=1 Tax=Aquarana catesbeiana TaxID=8400 RepID=UPI003CC9E584
MKIEEKDFCELKMTTCKMQNKELKKRERNREAAYKSRQKHTQHADNLHQEYESLEKSNTALRKEIQKLQQEQAYWAKILQQHEDTCLLLSPDIILELQKPAPLVSPKEIHQMSFDF